MFRRLSLSINYSIISYRSINSITQNILKNSFSNLNRLKLINNRIMDFKVLEIPDKSQIDEKDYRLIQLCNGLKALLIHDPSIEPVYSSESESDDNTDAETASDDDSSSSSSYETESDTDESNTEILSAVALAVDVGSFSDPPDVQGLAHFLEHMIFMGSEKYPKENEFDSYIMKNGGSDNAYTDCEETVFYFEVSEAGLEGAIDRFSALFISPLLLKEAMTRERESVESEFQSKLHNDAARRDQLLAEMGNDYHPSKLFTWGNLKTLKEEISDDDLYRKVQEFQKRHYSAHRMYLTIQSRMELDELQEFAVKYFSKIPSNYLNGLDFTKFNHENAFSSDFYNKVFYVRPTVNVCKLEFTWCLPSFLKQYLTKPHHFISYIVGYEGKGSLCAYLREKLWGMDVVTGIDESGFEHNHMYSLYSITIVLTDEGYDNIESVLKAVCWYLRLLKQEDLESRFQELQTIENTSFEYKSKKDPIDNVEELCVNVKYYPSKHILTGPHLYFEYNKNQIDEMVSFLNSPKFNIMISKKNIPGIEYDQKERWFGTEYTTRDIPKSWIEIWEKSEPVDGLFLVKPNLFITTDFTRLAAENPQMYPQLLISNDVCELWYKQDTKFNRPIAFMYFYIISPIVSENTKNATLHNLYSLILKYTLVEELYSAEVAGLEYETYSAEMGLVIKVYGYNQKLHLVVDNITKKLTKFLGNVTDEIFNTYKMQLGKIYSNGIMKPKILNKEIRLNVVENVRFPSYEKYNQLDGLKLNDLLEFGERFLKNLKITSIIQGNVSNEHACEVVRNILNNLTCEPINDIKSIYPRAVQLPIGEKYIRIKTQNKKDCNTIITNFYQIGPSTIKLTSLLDLLVMLFEEPLFDVLRTKEQLCYDIGCRVRDNFSILGFSITINSQETKFKCCDIEKRIEKFRHEFLELLRKMPNDVFERTKESLIKLNQLEDTTLKDEVVRNWAEITTMEYIFDRREREVKVLQTLTKSEFLNFYTNLITKKDEIRKLSIQVVGEKDEVNDNLCDDTMPASYDLEYDERFFNDIDNILNINDFKKNLYVYPVTKTTF